jgi:4-hydroxybenzoate polyprenyltransferase
MAYVNGLLRLMRPYQWVKSGFVLTGILFANAWRDSRLATQVLLTAVAFSLVASGVYAINDLIDREQDLNHPAKRNRPLAANLVSGKTAIILGFALWLIGLSLGLLVSTKVLLILAIYIGINIAYSLGLKHIVLLDVFIIAGGFMLRILAGTTGVGIAPSQWILLCGMMVALFLGFAKRRAEIYTLSEESATHRRVLVNYTPVLLDKMIVVTATCVILTYSLYTMAPATIETHKTDALIYTVPFVMYGIFRYIYTLHTRTSGTDPAQEIFRDPHLLLAVTGWLLLTLWLIR